VKNESVILELQRATHATLHRLATDLADLNLTPSEINALGNLAEAGGEAEAGGRTVSELGAAAGTRSATLTGILDRLERRGLITRGARPGDRRAVLIELTEDGREAAARILRTLHDLEKRAFADLPPDAVDEARAVLRALARAER
jgi:MarR family transcriptional regulator, organic hydroperoxide resistance regulator